MQMPEWMKERLDTPSREQARKLIEAAPDLTHADHVAANGEFPAYLFRVRKDREIWTTCCRTHEFLPEDSEILQAPHRPEPRSVFCCPGGARYATQPPKDPPPLVSCPFCGRKAAVKELGRTGKRDNLLSCQRIVILKWQDGALWAIALYGEKKYTQRTSISLVASLLNEEMLMSLPTLDLKCVYRFSPGFAARAARNGEYQELSGDTLKRNFSFQEPFGFSWQDELRYSILGLDQLAESHLHWCGLENYIGSNVRFIKLLAVASFYPRQVEMLTKAGLRHVVADFVNGKKKNAAVMNWENANPLQSFALTRPELKEFLSGDKDLAVLRIYQRMKKAGIPMTFPELYDLKNTAGPVWFERVLRHMEKHRLSWERFRNYLEKEATAENSRPGKKKSAQTKTRAIGLWCDYLDAAETLEYDLTNEVYLIPKGLTAHHDRAVKAAQVVTKSRKNAAMEQKARSRCRTLTKRYTYTDGDWLIRPPVNADEIVAEGKALRHCVGGYAERHVKGQVTILFLRDRRRPGVPLVTIEMRKNEIVQIHGFRNEQEACPENPDRVSPRELYRDFLDGWLAWLEAGSRRDKQGRPVLPQTVRQEERVILVPALVMA